NVPSRVALDRAADLASPAPGSKVSAASNGMAPGAAASRAAVPIAGCEADSDAAGTTLNDETSFPVCSGPGPCGPGQLHTALYSTVSPTLSSGKRAKKYWASARTSVWASEAWIVCAAPPFTV